MANTLCVGIGHVGLPLSLKLWQAGHDVGLVDIDTAKIEALRHGRLPFLERGCDDLLRAAYQDGRFHSRVSTCNCSSSAAAKIVNRSMY